MRLRLCFAIAALAALCASSSEAAVLYSGGTYGQSFDTLPSTPENVSLGGSPVGWINDTTSPGASQFSILGWHLHHVTPQTEGGANGNQRMRIGAGSANTGAFMSFGTSGSGERALGSLASATTAGPNPSVGPPAVAGGQQFMGVRLTNNTFNVLTQFTLTYDGEQWRNAGAPAAAEKLVFSYSLAATAIQTGTYLPVSTLDFTAPITAVNGNGFGNTTGRVNNISATITGLTWLPNTDLWLRWMDENNAGDDDGLGIDDVEFSARRPLIPEPGSMALAGIGALTVMVMGRRRK